MRQTEPYSIHWFKKIFFGILGGLAMGQAASTFGHRCLRLDEAWLGSVTEFPSIFARASAVQWMMLAYFILNVVRYTLSTYIFDRSSVTLNHSPKALGRELLGTHPDRTAEVLRPMLKRVSEEAEQPWAKRAVFLIIIDIFASSLTIILLGGLGGFIASFLPFASLSVLVLIADLLQICYQQVVYVPAMQRRLDGMITQMMARLEQESAGQHEQEVKNEAGELLIALGHKREKSLRDAKAYRALFYRWISIDILEITLWLVGIWLFLRDPVSPFIAIVLAVLFASYALDVWKNSDAWRDMLGVDADA